MKAGKKTIFIMITIFFSFFVVLCNNEYKVKAGLMNGNQFQNTIITNDGGGGGGTTSTYPTNPTLYTDAVDNVLTGDAIDFTFSTPEGGLETEKHKKISGCFLDYANAYICIKSYYYGKIKYDWSTSTSGFEKVNKMSTAHTYVGKTENEYKADFSIAAPSVTTDTTYYLKIVFDEDIKFGDLKLSSEGKIFAIFSQDNKEITYKYKVLAKNDAPKIYCNGSEVTSAKTLKECKLSFSDDLLLSSYVVYNRKTNKNYISVDNLSSTSYNTGTSLQEGLWQVKVFDIKNEFVAYDITVDKTSPQWYAADVTEVKAGSTLSFTLTDSVSGIYGYSSTLYWKYAWSSSGTTAPSYSSFTSITNKSSSKIMLDLTVSSLTSRTTSYLWIECRGKDEAGNVSTFSGKEPYYKGDYYTSYIAYKYTIVPEDEEAPKIKYGGTELEDTTYYKYSSIGITLTISDNKQLSYYKVTRTYSLMGQTNTELLAEKKNLSITSGTYTLSNTGKYEIVVKDATGNTTSRTIIVDGNAPTIKCGDTTLSTSSSSPTYKNTDCTLSFSDDYNLASYTISDTKSLSGTISGTSYTNNNVKLSDAGTYKIVVKDAAGNTKTSYLTIDKTTPVISCSSSSISAYSSSPTYKNSCSLKFSDDTNLASYTISGAISKSGSISGTSYTYGSLSTEGSYSITVKDAAGNETTGYVNFDKTAPTITCGGTTLSTSSSSPTYKNTNCKLSISDDNNLSSYVINGAESKSGTTSLSNYSISNEGEYTILAYDKAGNSKRAYITIDETAPIWEIIEEETNSITVCLSDSSGSGIYNYDDSEYYQYGWSSSSKAEPSSWNNFDKQNASEINFKTEIPQSIITTTKYLWIKHTGKDIVGNIATYDEGVVPYSIGTSNSDDYLIYEFKVEGTTKDMEAPKILCGTKEITGDVTLPSCELNFSDDVFLASYAISGKITASDNSISGTTKKYGSLSTGGSYTITVKDAAEKTTTRVININTSGPKLNGLSENLGYFVNSSYTFVLDVDAYANIRYKEVNDSDFADFTDKDNIKTKDCPSMLKANTKYSIEDLIGNEYTTYIVEIKFVSNDDETKGNESYYYFNVNDSYLGCVKVNGEKYCKTDITITGNSQTSIEIEDSRGTVNGYNNVEMLYISTIDKDNRIITDVFGNEFKLNIKVVGRVITKDDLCLKINGVEVIPEDKKVYYSKDDVTIKNDNVGLTKDIIENEISVSTNGTLTKYTATLDDDVRVFYVYVADSPMMSIYEKNTNFAFEWDNISYSTYYFKEGFVPLIVTGYDLDKGFEFYDWGLGKTNASSLDVIQGSFTLTLEYANITPVSRKIMFIKIENAEMKENLMKFESRSDTEIIIDGMNKYEDDNEHKIDEVSFDIYYAINEENLSPKIIINDNNGIQKIKIEENSVKNNVYDNDNFNSLVNKTCNNTSYEKELSLNGEQTIYKVKVVDNLGYISEKYFVLLAINRSFDISGGKVNTSAGNDEELTIYEYTKEEIDFKFRMKSSFEENIFTEIENGKLKRDITLKDSKITFAYALFTETININYITDLTYDAVNMKDKNSVALYVQACIEKKTDSKYEEFVKEGVGKNVPFSKNSKKSKNILSSASEGLVEGKLDLGDLLSYANDDILEIVMSKSIYGYITKTEIGSIDDAKEKLENHGVKLELDSDTNTTTSITIYNNSYNYASFGLYDNLIVVTIKLNENSTSSTGNSCVDNNGLVTLSMLPSYKKQEYLL